jgi:hypothetical protein
LRALNATTHFSNMTANWQAAHQRVRFADLQQTHAS